MKLISTHMKDRGIIIIDKEKNLIFNAGNKYKYERKKYRTFFKIKYYCLFG